MRAVGIDIGGTKIAVAAVEAGGHIRARTQIPTQAQGPFAPALERIVTAVEAAARQAGWSMGDLEGVGIGCAGPVDPVGGSIHNPFTLPGWGDAQIVAPLREQLGVEVRLENDADAAAMGECVAGAGQGCTHVVMLTFGTGIGGAAIIEGRIHRGARGEHPEFGHVPAMPEGPACYCGVAGCLESVASGTAIGSAGQAMDLPTAESVFAAAAAGDARAATILERAVEATARAAWTIAHTFLPQRLILGGGVMEGHFDVFAGRLRERLARASMVPPGLVEVVRASLGNDAGVIGAAWMGAGATAG